MLNFNFISLFVVSRCRFGRCTRTNNSRRWQPHHSASSVSAGSCSSSRSDASTLSVSAVNGCNDQASSGSWSNVRLHFSQVCCYVFKFRVPECMMFAFGAFTLSVGQ